MRGGTAWCRPILITDDGTASLPKLRERRQLLAVIKLNRSGLPPSPTGRRREVPSAKLQSPMKLQPSSSKRCRGCEAASVRRSASLGNWILGFLWCLGFGIWRFSSCLYGLLPEHRFQLIELLTQFLDFAVAPVQFLGESLVQPRFGGRGSVNDALPTPICPSLVHGPDARF